MTKTLPIDHILYGVPNLEEGMTQLHKLTGVEPAFGGKHPGMGTRNALLGLGGNVYLEIIAPDPDQEVNQVWMDLDKLAAPKLFRWAAYRQDLPAFQKTALSNGIDIGEIRPGSRKTPDGSLLEWRLSDPGIVLGDGIIPFFIDWGVTGNPTPTLPKGCLLTALHMHHPSPEQIQAQLKTLGIEVVIKKDFEPKLSASLMTPNGPLELF